MQFNHEAIRETETEEHPHEALVRRTCSYLTDEAYAFNYGLFVKRAGGPASKVRFSLERFSPLSVELNTLRPLTRYVAPDDWYPLSQEAEAKRIANAVMTAARSILRLTSDGVRVTSDEQVMDPESDFSGIRWSQIFVIKTEHSEVLTS